MYLWVAAITFFCLSAGAEVAANDVGREFFVSSSRGDDANSGKTSDEPLRSVTKAVESAAPGDTITLLPGWHEGGIRLKPGTKGRPITLRASRKGRVFLGRPSVLTGFKRFEGYEYTYTADLTGERGTIFEVDSNRVLREMAAPIDVEELAGTCCFDRESRKLFGDWTREQEINNQPLRQVSGSNLFDHFNKPSNLRSIARIFGSAPISR